jgi:hypothetical protein
MQLELIGPHPFTNDKSGNQAAHIGTIFLDPPSLYTRPPEVHLWQRLGFVDYLNAGRSSKGMPPLSPQDEDRVRSESVDLIFEPDQILIRPDPERMDLAFAADELLQTLASKRQIKFLSVSDPRVREAIKRRGEYWRMSSIPKTQDARETALAGCRVKIHGQPIYFYNRLTGTRWLTYREFEKLGQLEPALLARHLQEIADHALHRNRLQRPEVDFFAADLRRFGPREFAGVVYDQLSPEQLRAKYESLKEHFRSAVHESFRQDNPSEKAWAERMLSTMFLEGNEAQTEQLLSGLSPEFFMKIEWLPGGRFEEGEFIVDSLFEEFANNPADEGLQNLCDPCASGMIFNLIREYGGILYINIGRLPEPLSLTRPQQRGRRAVYIAEFQCQGEPGPIRRFIRLQKWGVREHLEEGKNLEQSVEESEDYTDYWLDRRLGCRQLGMKLTGRVVMRRLTEIYNGSNAAYRGRPIRTTYFEREYLPGIATDKLPLENYTRPGYAARLATFLGEAAASSMIVGRWFTTTDRPIFDDGDEVVLDGPDGLPKDVLVGDHSGSFAEYDAPLADFAAHYASVVNRREKILPDPIGFAEAYLAAFRLRFLHIQGDYRKRRRAFDRLFKHCRYDPAGSFAYRWERVLRRLDETDVEALIRSIRAKIRVLERPGPPEGPVALGAYQTTTYL